MRLPLYLHREFALYIHWTPLLNGAPQRDLELQFLEPGNTRYGWRPILPN